ncbi:MAG: hypothetical protein M3N29_01935 [Chloroflexota bacterium]|nr:hypothetical protein [Chloroflexota bacterium]
MASLRDRYNAFIDRHEVAWEQLVMDAFAARRGRAGQQTSRMLDEVLP